MVRAIIRFSAQNRVLVLLATACVVAYGLYTLQRIPVDAIPDLSDTQVIVYSRWDRSPDIVEDQVTYPIVSALLGTPRVKTIRGFSDFGFSYVYVIFEDGTDIYWARSRVLEYLSKIQPVLPEGVRTELGPDATGIGWVFQYALVDDSGTQSLADLRTLQDWNLRYRVQSVPGVAEVASIGGFVQQYQVTVDPNRLRAFDLGIMEVAAAVKSSNSEVGGRLLEFAGREFMVRGRGYVNRRPTSNRWCSRPTSAARPSCCATSRRWRSAPRCAAASRISTAWGNRSAASWSCATQRTPATSSTA